MNPKKTLIFAVILFYTEFDIKVCATWYDSDLLNNTRIIQQDNDAEEEKISPKSSYMDHKGLFCGARMSDLVTLNVTSRWENVIIFTEIELNVNI